MNMKSRPLFLLVCTLLVLLLTLSSYWLALMPQRAMRALQGDMLRDYGLVMEAGTARLDYSSGFGTILENVSMVSQDLSPVKIDARALRLPGVLGGDLTLSAATFDVPIDTVKGNSLAFQLPLTLEDCIFKLRDHRHKAVIAISDVNGRLSTDGAKGMQGRFGFVLGSQFSDLRFTIEDQQRFIAAGSPADFTLTGKNMMVAFAGQSKLSQGLALAGQMNIEANDVAALFKWFSIPLNSLADVGPFKLQSGVASTGLAMDFKAFTATTASANLKGGVTVAAGPDRPILSGDVDISQLSLWGPMPATSNLAQPWPETALPVSDVTSIDLALNVNVQKLFLRGHDLGALALRADATGGQLSLTAQPQAFALGTIEFATTLTPSSGALQIAMKTKAKAVAAKAFLGALFGFDLLDGPVDVTMDWTATGTSVASLVSTLKGTFEMKATDMALAGVKIESLLATPGTGWKADETLSTPHIKLDVVSRVVEGVMALTKASVGFGSASLAPHGEIDLLRQAFDIVLSPKGSGTAPKLVLQGTWLSPVFSNADSGKSGVATPPPAN